MASACDICSAPGAPFGFRPPGLASKLPERLRGFYLWTCARPTCRDAARDRALAAVHADAKAPNPPSRDDAGPLFRGAE